MFWIISVILNCATASAEYRVFDLIITDTQTKAVRTVVGTLDPFQYPGYYDVKKTETVLYQATWMCWGDTSSMAPLCPNPKPIASQTTTPPVSPAAK